MKRLLCLLSALLIVCPYFTATAIEHPTIQLNDSLNTRTSNDNNNDNNESIAPNTEENLKQTLTVPNASTQLLRYLDTVNNMYNSLKGVKDIKANYIREYAKGMIALDWILSNTFTKDISNETVIPKEILETYISMLKEYQSDLLSKSSEYSEYDIEKGKPRLEDLFILDGVESYSDFSTTTPSNKHAPLNDVKLMIVNYFENSILTLIAQSVSLDKNDISSIETVHDLNELILKTVKDNNEIQVNDNNELENENLKPLFIKAEQASGVSLRSLYNEYKAVELFMRTMSNTKLEDSSVTVNKASNYNIDDYLKVGSVVSAYFNYIESQSGTDTITPPNNQTIQTDTTDILSLMSNARIIGNNIETLNNADGELTDLGFAIISAGVVNDPFVSVAGNDLYNSTILEFVKDKKSEVSSILETAINTKKPLYVTSSRDKSFMSASDFSINLADYKLAMLSDMLDYEKSPIKAFALIKGSMRTSKIDSSQMEYVRGNNTTSTSNETTNGSEVEIDNGNNSPTIEIQQSNKNTNAEDNITVGSATVSGTSSMMTKPVAYYAGQQVNLIKGSMFGGGLKSGDAGVGVPYLWGSTTAALLRNAQLDSKNNKHIKNASKEMLFMNGLGDIVLEDNTIILPAIANPTFYTHKDEKAELNKIGEPNLVGGDGAEYEQVNKGTYYPYTVAFFNHYPDVGVYNGSTISTANPNDKNKWVLVNTPSGYGYKELKNVGQGSTDIKYGFLDYSLTMAVDSLKVTQDEKAGYNGFRIFELNQDKVGWLDKITNIKNTVVGKFRYYVKQQPLTTEGLPLFPINYSAEDPTEQYLGIAGALTTSALRFISTPNTGTSTLKSSGMFRTDFFVKECLAECRRGTQYSSTIVKNMKVSYDEIVEDTGSRILKMFMFIAESAVKTLGKIEGVLSIRNMYENPFLNGVALFLNEYYIFIAIGLVLVVASRFLRGYINFIYLIFLSVMVIAGFEVYTKWIPTVVPSMYNMVVNDIMESITWNTIFNNAERYSELYSSDGDKSFDGADKPYTATITLYTLNSNDILTVSDKLGVSASQIQSGKLISLDEQGGVFLQGNQIKMSVDALLLNNSVRGLYSSQWEQLLQNEEITSEDDLKPIDSQLNKNPYIIKYDTHYKGLENYYTPYHKIQEQFMSTLNKFTNIFTMERNTFSYGRSIYKDAFVVSKFINSGIFLAPGDDDILRLNINDKNITGEPYDIEKVIDYVHELFNPQEDWLNLREIFENPDEEFIDSLWGAMLVKNDYYDIDFKYNDKQAEKISKLISYINEQTKIWILKNKDNLNFISDDNAIKLISLYATTCFNQKVSQYSNWLYPVYINSQDITLEDVLYGTTTTILDRNSSLDGTVINTVALTNGTFGVIFVTLILVIASLFTFIITYLIPILYLLFGILLVLKLLRTDSGVSLFRGYCKITLVTIVLYIIFSLSFKFIEIGGYQWYGFFGCAVMLSCCLYLLILTVYSIITDIFNLGDNTIYSNLKGVASNLMNKIGVGKIIAHTVNTHNGNYNRNRTNTFSNYFTEENIDKIMNIVSSRNVVRTTREPGVRERARFYRNNTSSFNDISNNMDSDNSSYYDFNSSIDDIDNSNSNGRSD